jgi:SOS regulatory protein LexA
MKEAYKNKVLTFYKKHRRMPTYSEIMNLVGFRSKNSVYKLVEQLVKDGFLSKDKHGRLIPCNLYGETPFLGYVEAGFPSPAEEELVDTMSFDEYLIANKEATYILKVKGDSMVDAGICPGDMVIVERTENPKVGNIVIAEVDGEWTMKYFKKRAGKTYLEPANKKYKSIYPKEGLKIAAVVRGVVRKY